MEDVGGLRGTADCLSKDAAATPSHRLLPCEHHTWFSQDFQFLKINEKFHFFHINLIISKHWQLLKKFSAPSGPNKAHLWADMAGGLPANSGIGNGRRWSELKYGMKAPGLLIVIAAKWALDVSLAGNRNTVGGLNTRRSQSNSTNAEE